MRALRRTGLILSLIAGFSALGGGIYSFANTGNELGTVSTKRLPAAAGSAATTTTTAPKTVPPDRMHPREMMLASALKAAPPPVVTMPDVGGGLSQGSSGATVLAYEQRLAALKFDPGPVDGVFDQSTRYAVEALEKITGLPRSGVIGQGERAAIGNFKYPAALTSSGSGTRAEVSLDGQYMIVYQNGLPRLITTVSTGSGKHFCGGDDGCQYAVTPPGSFTFNFRRNGWHKGKLGSLYNPVYFNGGIAVHGYESVPTYNASHGCVRIPMGIAEYFPSLVPNGVPMYVVGTPAPQVG